jgi:hypothetical protein
MVYYLPKTIYLKKLIFVTIIAVNSLLLIAFFTSCATFKPIEPNALILFSEGDSLLCKIVWNEILTITAVSDEYDTLQIENSTIEKILEPKTYRDITSEYIDRDQMKHEYSKRIALKKRDKLRADVQAGLKKYAELSKVPMALLKSSLYYEEKKIPELHITVLNLSPKIITLFRARIYCYDTKGKILRSPKKKDNSFEAISKFPIQPDDEFTTALLLRNYSKARKVKVEIIQATFADNSIWKGKIEEIAIQ